MADPLEKLKQFLLQTLWGRDISKLNRAGVWGMKFLRLLYVAVREFENNELNLQAANLVYTTLLGMVPFLAVSFSVLAAFGVKNLVAPFVEQLLSPLGPESPVIAAHIVAFVKSLKIGVLSSVGLVLLVYSAVSIIQKIEGALNFIWRSRKQRTFAQRFSQYTSVILVGPVLVFAAIGLTASIASNAVVRRLMSMPHFGTVSVIGGKLMPYVLIIAAFTFTYSFLPAARVKLKSAFVGGIFAGVMWQTVGWAFTSFIASSAQYSAVYSGFAILILFIIWVNLSWRVFLVGGSISFYYQYPHLAPVTRELALSGRLNERLALVIMYLIGYNYYFQKPLWDMDRLVERLGLPLEPVSTVLDILQKRGLVIESVIDSTPSFVPARPVDMITVREVLESARAAEEDIYSIGEKISGFPRLEMEMKQVDEAVSKALGENTIKDLFVTGMETAGVIWETEMP